MIICSSETLSPEPSTAGAYAWKDDNGEVHAQFVEPGHRGIEKYTYANLSALALDEVFKYLPSDWKGEIFTDSSIIRLILVGGRYSKYLPEDLAGSLIEGYETHSSAVLLTCAHHPSPYELSRGATLTTLPAFHETLELGEACHQAIKAARPDSDLWVPRVHRIQPIDGNPTQWSDDKVLEKPKRKGKKPQLELDF